jgi:hypothetical protein
MLLGLLALGNWPGAWSGKPSATMVRTAPFDEIEMLAAASTEPSSNSSSSSSSQLVSSSTSAWPVAATSSSWLPWAKASLGNAVVASSTAAMDAIPRRFSRSFLEWVSVMAFAFPHRFAQRSVSTL